MQRVVACPVCKQPLADSEPECPHCGAYLPLDVFQSAGTVDEERTAPGPTAGELDELTEAFVAQFTGVGVVLPKRWVQRLRSLATQVETSRRFATVVFVDLRGYTNLTQVLDEVSLDRLRQWYYELVTRRVEQYGGFVIQLVGDAVFAAFGAPWAFERDAESAIRALIDIREDVRRQGTFQDFPLAIRAGADSGPLNVRLTATQGQSRPDLFGSTVNLAARLEAQAATWEILVSESLADQVRHVCVLETREAFEPHNYGQLVHPSAVVGIRPDAGGRRRDHRSPWIGRSEELAELCQILTPSGGTFREVHILGDAGLGKTRLIREALKQLQRDFPTLLVAQAECEPPDRFVPLGIGLKLLERMARTLAGVALDQSLEGTQTLGILRSVLESDPVGAALLPTLGFLLQVEPHRSQLANEPPHTLRAQVVPALAHSIILLSRLQPWVLVVDDAQWCDRMTCDVLEEIRAAQSAGVRLVLVARDEDEAESLLGDSDTPCAFAGNGQQASVIRLLPLGESDQGALLAALAPHVANHPLVLRRILEESEGIPLYIVEMGGELSDRLPEGESDALQELAAQAISNDTLPRTILGILQARVDRLSPHRRAVLQSASVLGRRFAVSALELFSTIRQDLLAELFALKGLRMMDVEDLPEDLRFYFTPSALRNTAYQMLTREQRAGLHRQVAAMIEQRYPERLDDFAFDLALHYVRGFQPEAALPYLRLALEKSTLLGMPHDAYALLLRALEPLPADMPGTPPPIRDAAAEASWQLVRHQQRILLEDAGGRACRVMGDLPRSTTHFQGMLTLAEELQHAGWIAGALQQLALNALEQGNLDEATQLLKKGEALPKLPTLIRLRLLNAGGEAAYRRGDLDTALDCWYRVATAEPGTLTPALARIQADAASNRGLIFWQQGDLSAATEAFQLALHVWEGQRILPGQALCHNNLGILAEKQGQWTAAEEHYRFACEVAENTGQLIILSAVANNRSNLHLLRREFEAARELAERARRWAEAVRHASLRASAALNEGLALLGMMLWTEAREVLNSAREKLAGADLGVDAELVMALVSLDLEEDPSGRAARLRLETLAASLPDHLQAWRDILDAQLASAEDGLPQLLAPESVLADLNRGGHTIENLLRRVDGGVSWARRTSPPMDETPWQEARSAILHTVV
jgi:class 3 adenylate cyclase/tetratricopeptide (TPR) repeat protein